MSAQERHHHYTCAHCKGEFVSERPEQEAKTELMEKFGTTLEETECVEICDDCWIELGLSNETHC